MTAVKRMTTVKTFEDIFELNQFTAEKFIEIGNEAIKKNDRFTIALAGGSTPRGLYQLLTTEEFKDKIDWEKVFFFFGDERDVSPMSDLSNFRMASEILLKPLNIPNTNIIRWQTEIIDANGVADTYKKTISRFFELETGEFPRFDLILLGMGEDGHTASLFPKTKALNVNDRIVVSHYVEKLDTNRLTFTYPTINNALNIIFMVSGKGKAETLKEVLEDDMNHIKYPSQNINPIDGKLLWLVDKEAASLLSE